MGRSNGWRLPKERAPHGQVPAVSHSAKFVSWSFALHLSSDLAAPAISRIDPELDSTAFRSVQKSAAKSGTESELVIVNDNPKSAGRQR
jgi:hypothetical protein